MARSALILLAGAAALAVAHPLLSSRSCDFDSAKAPSCWGKYDLSTDYYSDGPDTGVIREYTFNIVEGPLAPDGVSRETISINGQVPGPTIEADWGDTIVVHVTNNARINGTSIHFHGVRQYFTNPMDGVAAITQCPSKPGSTVTYRWKAGQYGTSWYHSHFSLQAWDGVFGAIKINGPASAPYDVDLGPVILADWYHQGIESIWEQAQTTGAPDAPNGLINGLNVFTDGTGTTTGSRWESTFEAGKSYRIGLINSAIDTHFRFMLDGHTMTVIAADFVAIKPYETDTLSIGIGERYDVIIKADQPSGDYWFRAIPQSCSTTNTNGDNIRGIIRYGSSSTSDPTSTPWDYTDSCDDEDIANLVPALSLDGGAKDASDDVSVGLTTFNGNFRWTLNDDMFMSQWDYPTSAQVAMGNLTFDAQQQIVEMPDAGKFFYLIIENTLGLPHPIHLHGHDFYILSQSSEMYNAGTTPINLSNPPRRDVAMLPASGHLVLGFYSDNPGVWLVHCHIGWHTGEGLAVQILERPSEIAALYQSATTTTNIDLNSTCSDWQAWRTGQGISQTDTGI